MKSLQNRSKSWYSNQSLTFNARFSWPFRWIPTKNEAKSAIDPAACSTRPWLAPTMRQSWICTSAMSAASWETQVTKKGPQASSCSKTTVRGKVFEHESTGKKRFWGLIHSYLPAVRMMSLHVFARLLEYAQKQI